MKNWMNTSWIGRRVADAKSARALRRLAAGLFATLAFAAALPAGAFERTSFGDGRFEYFFDAPSLDISGTGDLDLTGLSFIEGVAGGFRVGALFDLDWLGGEQAAASPSLGAWSGLELLPRTLSFVAGGNLSLGSARLTLHGGTISLAAAGTLTIGDGAVFDVGSGGAGNGDPGIGSLPWPPRGSGELAIGPGGSIDLNGRGGSIDLNGPSPIPEPTSTALLLAGLAVLAGKFGRRARARR